MLVTPSNTQSRIAKNGLIFGQMSGKINGFQPNFRRFAKQVYELGDQGLNLLGE